MGVKKYRGLFAVAVAVVIFPTLLIAFVVLLAPGRYLEAKKQVTLCERETISVYPGQEFDTSAVMASYMIRCMEAESYVLNNSDAECRFSDSRFETNPHCYFLLIGVWRVLWWVVTRH